MLRPVNQLATYCGHIDHHYQLEGLILLLFYFPPVLGYTVQMFLLFATIKKPHIISWHHTFVSKFYKGISNMCNLLTNMHPWAPAC